MKGRKIVTVLIIINLILVGIIYSLINKENVNNQKQIIKEMAEIEYENSIKSLNASHEEYANHIEESKKKIASAITDMGIETAETADALTMANNIRRLTVESSEEKATEFILSSMAKNWSLSNTESTTFTMSNNNMKLAIEKAASSYVIYKNTVKLKGNPILIVNGYVNFNQSTGSSGNYQSYGYVEISTDNGSTWTNLFTCQNTLKTDAKTSTTNFAQIINLDDYKNKDCLFRMGISANKYYEAILNVNSFVLIN